MTPVEIGFICCATATTLFGLSLTNLRLAIVVTMSLASFTITWNDVRVGIVTLSDLFLVATAALVLATSPPQVRPLRKPFGGSQKSLFLYACILFFGGVIGGILRREPDIGFAIALRFLASVVVVVFLVSAIAGRRMDWERYAMWYVLGAAVNGLVAITGGDQLAGRSLGLNTHPNHLGLATMLAFFLAIATQGSPNKIVRYATAVSIAPILGALVLSGSRGALASLAVGLLVLVLMRRGRAVPWTLGILFAAIIGYASLPEQLRSGPTAFGRILSPSKGEARSGAERWSYAREASDAIQSNPVFGEGFSQALTFHSVPLQVLVVGGIVGLAALLVLIRGLLRSVRHAIAPDRRRLERACGAALVATAFFLLTENMLFDRYYLFFVSMAFMACSPQLVSAAPSDEHQAQVDQRITERA